MRTFRIAITLAVLLGIALAGCAKRSSRKISVEGPENKYEVKFEKSEKAPD
jgi:uncharacterized protein YceK